MIRLQKSNHRRYVRNGSKEIWMTFDPENVGDPFRQGFRALRSLNEVRLSPGAKVTLKPEGPQESMIYVREGGLAVRGGTWKDDILGPGHVQCANERRQTIRGTSNGSSFPGAHIFVGFLALPQDHAGSFQEHRYYPFADRRGHLRLVASPEGSDASLRLHQDIQVYSSVLDPGHHVVHELGSGRGVWLQIVFGKVRLIDQTLDSGDGAALDGEAALSLTAQEPSEVLVFDLA